MCLFVGWFVGFWSLWIGGLWERSERPNSTLHERERERERLSFDVLVEALPTQDPKKQHRRDRVKVGKIRELRMAVWRAGDPVCIHVHLLVCPDGGWQLRPDDSRAGFPCLLIPRNHRIVVRSYRVHRGCGTAHPSRIRHGRGQLDAADRFELQICPLGRKRGLHPGAEPSQPCPYRQFG